MLDAITLDATAWLLLVGMASLLAGSAFFSASEAAFFSLTETDIASFSGLTGRTISLLLSRAERLLSAILFYNLTINVTYFAIATILTHRIGGADGGAWWVPTLSFAVILLTGELFPKSLGVTAPRFVASTLAMPLSWSIAVAAPITPLLQAISETSRRLVWPAMSPEGTLAVSDLERAIELSGADASLIEHEKQMLQNTVQLSVVRVEEWMRPRSSLPTVDLHDDLDQQLTLYQQQHGEADLDYVLVSSDASDIAGCLQIADSAGRAAGDWRSLVKPVLVAPWCQTLSVVLSRMQKKGRPVAIVVNEFGETIGVITIDDLIESIFCVDAGDTSFGRPAFDQTGTLQWEVTGGTSLRRIERALGRKLPSGRQVTLAGVMQNELERLPQPGDVVEWGGFRIEVVEVPRRGEMLLRLTVSETATEGEGGER